MFRETESSSDILISFFYSNQGEIFLYLLDYIRKYKDITLKVLLLKENLFKFYTMIINAG